MNFLLFIVAGIFFTTPQVTYAFYHPSSSLKQSSFRDCLIFSHQITSSRRYDICATLVPEQENANSASPIELFERLDDLYTQSSIKIKCPFFRRRAADLIDGIAMVTRFLLIRHKSILGLIDPTSFSVTDDTDYLGAMLPPGCRATKRKSFRVPKCCNLNVEDIKSIIYRDWTQSTTAVVIYDEKDRNKQILVNHDKGYYITGKLNSTIYRDDCLFNGPDPDMPVKGLRKYLSAASKLFDHKSSYADLLELKVLEKDDTTKTRVTKIEAKWRIAGVIMLPWHPIVKPYTGKTTYHFDEDGLIYHHEEKWDISVWEAFMNTVFPEVGERLWGKEGFISALSTRQ